MIRLSLHFFVRFLFLFSGCLLWPAAHAEPVYKCSQGGKISFSFYLLHMGLLHLLAQRVGLVHPTGNDLADLGIMLLVAYGATWALATLSYNAIEEPFLKMRRRYGASDVIPAKAGT